MQARLFHFTMPCRHMVHSCTTSFQPEYIATRPQTTVAFLRRPPESTFCNWSRREFTKRPASVEQVSSYQYSALLSGPLSAISINAGNPALCCRLCGTDGLALTTTRMV